MTLENPLGQAELDALLRTLLPPSEHESLYQNDGSVRAYDFRRQSKFNKDQIRTLVMIHENFARLLTSFFAAGLRSRAQVTVRSATQFSFAELTQVMANPTVLCALRLHPLPGVALIEVSQNIAYAIVERVFGGPGSEVQPQRALSEIELAVIRRHVEEMLSPLREAWRNVADISPAVEAIETNPMFMQVAAPGEVMAALILGVQIGLHMGHITLALPFATVEPVLARLSPHSWFASSHPTTEEDRETLLESVQYAPVQVAAVLGRARVTVGEVLQLQVGDVIPLDTGPEDDVAVYVRNRLAFFGRPGVSRGRMAVQIRRFAQGP